MKENDRQSSDSGRAAAGDGGKAAGNIIKILADLPDFLRKPMLQSRLKEFYSMDKETQRETIQMALAAAPSIDAAKLSILLKTWLELLSDFDEQRRSLMFQTYCREIMASPAVLQKLDLKQMADVFLSLPEPRRQVLTDSINEVLFSTPRRQEILRMVPTYLLTALKLA